MLFFGRRTQGALDNVSVILIRELSNMSTINASSIYRVQGNVMKIADIAKEKPGFVIPATEEQIQELKLHDEQTRQREAAVAQYAEQHPSKMFGQVIVNGEVIATVYDSGSAETRQQIAGLKLTEDGSGLDLARTRLDEITKAVKGQVIYSNFVTRPGPASAVVSESALPQVTARSLNQMAREMDWALMRSRMIDDTKA